MFNKKVLKMVSSLASSTCKESNITLSPVDFDEFENAIDEAADASFEDGIDIYNDPNVIIKDPVSQEAAEEGVDLFNAFNTDETPTEEEEIISSDDNVVEETPTDTKMAVDEYKLMKDNDLFNELSSSTYPIARDEKCSCCNGAINNSDLIQITNDGKIHHTDCKFEWGKYVLKVFTPKDGKIEAFGTTWDAEDIIKSELNCAEIQAKAGPKGSLRGTISMSQFIMNYMRYCDNLNKRDLEKSESKSNLVKIRETK